jgi:2-phosphoglycolate phosphatase
VGSGARGMLRGAFDMQPADADYDAMRAEFLDLYEARMLLHTAPFAAVPGLLDQLDAHGIRWGIVTNKALRFAEPVTRALGLWPRAGALIGGDSTPHTKPHPAPLLEAARRLQIEPSACVYVGDDARDVQAGRAAGMATLAAAWGYLGPDADITLWAADDVIASPDEVLHWLELA